MRSHPFKTNAAAICDSFVDIILTPLDPKSQTCSRIIPFESNTLREIIHPPEITTCAGICLTADTCQANFSRNYHQHRQCDGIAIVERHRIEGRPAIRSVAPMRCWPEAAFLDGGLV